MENFVLASCFVPFIFPLKIHFCFLLPGRILTSIFNFPIRIRSHRTDFLLPPMPFPFCTFVCLLGVCIAATKSRDLVLGLSLCFCAGHSHFCHRFLLMFPLPVSFSFCCSDSSFRRRRRSDLLFCFEFGSRGRCAP
jgi:hypothetical protein